MGRDRGSRAFSTNGRLEEQFGDSSFPPPRSRPTTGRSSDDSLSQQLDVHGLRTFYELGKVNKTKLTIEFKIGFFSFSISFGLLKPIFIFKYIFFCVYLIPNGILGKHYI
jgi:hypothetical protein